MHVFVFVQPSENIVAETNIAIDVLRHLLDDVHELTPTSIHIGGGIWCFKLNIALNDAMLNAFSWQISFANQSHHAWIVGVRFCHFHHLLFQWCAFAASISKEICDLLRRGINVRTVEREIYASLECLSQFFRNYEFRFHRLSDTFWNVATLHHSTVAISAFGFA